MRKSENTLELELLAASQWGMFTTAQAQNLGIRRSQVARMVAAVKVEPMCYGVYRFLVGAEPPQADIKAQWLSVSPKLTAAVRLSTKPFDAVLAGRSAAYALGAGDFLAHPYTFIVRARKQTSREDVHYLNCRLDERDVTYVDGVPVTSFERTVYDLLRLDEDPDLVDKFMRSAVQEAGHRFDPERLACLLGTVASRYCFESGMAFATDLIVRNVAVIQMSQAKEALGGAAAALYGRDKAAVLEAKLAEALAGLEEGSDE